ncbi:MAG: type II and III secretion system protein [Rhodothermales bacterium]|nr:type II and III secretion system protein [Rhodothermales bacterium]
MMLVAGIMLIAGSALTSKVYGQEVPNQRQVRAYIPPDQLVSFLPSTPFNRFVEFVDPIFLRVTGKQIVDPEARTTPIGVSIAGMQFLDAFELVLQFNGLWYQETAQFFIVGPQPSDAAVVATGGAATGREPDSPATIDTREIQINAILFELDHSMARDTGLDWNVFFGEQTGSGQSGSGLSGGGFGGGTGSGGQGESFQTRPRFFLRTDDLFDSIDDLIVAPDIIDFSDLTQFFRLLENEGIGETIANPQVSVQSGQKGRFQSGSDVPVQVRDFAGNTVTQFFSTGIIVDVTPTLITQRPDDDSAEIDFVHLDVEIEKSGSSPSASGPVINRNTATTQVLLLDGEQTIIGGLYSTEESVSRSGIPVLKDLPGWFFGLRYLFGRSQRVVTQKELLIVLQANVRNDITTRANGPLQYQILKENRRMMERGMQQFDTEVAGERVKPRKYIEPGSN